MERQDEQATTNDSKQLESLFQAFLNEVRPLEPVRSPTVFRSTKSLPRG